jgi:hypothetical protein
VYIYIRSNYDEKCSFEPMTQVEKTSVKQFLSRWFPSLDMLVDDNTVLIFLQVENFPCHNRSKARVIRSERN